MSLVKGSWTDAFYVDSKLIPSRRRRTVYYVLAALFVVLGVASSLLGDVWLLVAALLSLACSWNIWNAAVVQYVLHKEPREE